MSIRNFRSTLEVLQHDIRMHPDLHAGFPEGAVDRAFQETSFEAAYAALDDLDSWLRAAMLRHPEEDWTETEHSILSARIHVDIALDCFEASPTGGLVRMPDEAPKTGAPRYHSLGNAALHHGFEVSVFRHRLRSVPVYEAKAALAAGFNGGRLPEQVGTRAEYRVAILDGEILNPPAWPADLLQRQAPEKVSGLEQELQGP